MISFLFAIPSISDVLDPAVNPSGFPILYILQQCTYKGTIPIVVVVLLVCMTGVTDSNCSTSRQIFAFARDGGLPFQKFLSKVGTPDFPTKLASLMISIGRTPNCSPKRSVCYLCHHHSSLTHYPWILDSFQCHHIIAAFSANGHLLYQYWLCPLSTCSQQGTASPSTPVGLGRSWHLD
jgi:amino acid transporter